MNATMTKVTDQRTAVTQLNHVRDALAAAVEKADLAMDELRDEIIRLRPLGLLSVERMGEAVGRDRNYIDSTWSTFGETVTGKQTRVELHPEAYPSQDDYDKACNAARDRLTKFSQRQKVTAAAVIAARAERDRVVAMVYQSKILGPSAIAAEVGVDRNHVGRIARRRGVKPVHRTKSRNQYSASHTAAPKHAA